MAGCFSIFHDQASSIKVSLYNFVASGQSTNKNIPRVLYATAFSQYEHGDKGVWLLVPGKYFRMHDTIGAMILQSITMV